jgi:hypothetical protein
VENLGSEALLEFKDKGKGNIILDGYQEMQWQDPAANDEVELYEN